MPLDPNSIIIPDLNERLNPDKILIPDLSQEQETVFDDKPNIFERIGGHLWSGAKRVPGDIARGLGVEIRDQAEGLKPKEDGEEAFYNRQLSVMTSVDKSRVFSLAREAEDAGIGIDSRTALRNAIDAVLDEKKEHALEVADAADKLAEHKAFQPLPGYEHPDSFGAAVLQGIGQQAVRMPLMLLAAPAAVPEMYLEISGATYKGLVENGVPPDRARLASRIDAAAQSPLEFLGDLVTIRSILGAKGWKALIAGIAKSSGTEGMEEFAQQYPDELATYWAMNPDATPQDIFDHITSGQVLGDALFSGLVGATVGGVLAGAGGATRYTLDRYITEKQKGVIEQRKQVLVDALGKARTGEALNEEEQELVNRVTEALPEDAIKRIQYQTPIISDARDEAYQGMSQIMGGDAVKTDAIMSILDSIAHSYGDLLGVEPEQFYEKELKVGGKISFEDFQSEERLAAQYQVAAWHGSPHTFDKFSKDKIGTGEGAQSYGYGMYFAGKKDVAEWYKRALSQWQYDGSSVSPYDDSPINARVSDGFLVSRLISGKNTKEGLLKSIDETLQDMDNKGLQQEEFNLNKSTVLPGTRQTRDDLLKLYSYLLKLEHTKGHLYEVELAPDEDEYLLWDKPLSEQSEKVKKNFRNLARFFPTEGDKNTRARIEHLLNVMEENPERVTGRNIYNELASRSVLGDKAASDYLHSLGIRGIKYLNGVSRAKGEGDYNYVIFSDEDVKIKTRYQGLPASPMGATAWTSSGQAIIYAFEGSNVSTPIHEIGHVLLGLIERYDPSSFRSIQSWLKIDENRAALGTQAWTTDEHEQFAKGFEVYMMEGRAPSFRLVPVFKKMKAWLLEIYRRITKLDVKINDDVRRVFDQWLTTEEDRQGDFVKDMTNWFNVDELGHPMGEINPDDYQDYEDIAAKAASVAASKFGASRKRKDAKIRDALWRQAKKIIDEDPFWQDIDYLKANGGLKTELVENMRNWGKDEMKVFREWGIISRSGHWSPDGYAHSRGLLGGRQYDRAEDFLDMVLDSPKKRDATRNVYARLIEEYEAWQEQEGPLITDAGEIIEAEIAILNALMGQTGAASRVLSREIGAVEDLTFEEVQNLKKRYKDLDKAAREAFNEGKVQGEEEGQTALEREKAKYRDRLQAQKEKADQKESGLRQKIEDIKDTNRAVMLGRILQMKEEQRIIVAKLKERQRVQKEKAKIQKRLKRYLKLKNMGYEARYQLQRLLLGYFPVRGYKEDLKQPDLVTYLSREIPIPGAAQWFSDLVDELPSPWRDSDNKVTIPGRRSLDDMQQVAALADLIVGMDRNRRKEILAGKLEERRLLAEGMYSAHGLAPQEAETVSSRPTWFENAADTKDTLMAELTKIEFLCNYLDSLEMVGPVWQKIFKPLAEAEDRKLVMLRRYMKDLHGILDPIANDTTWTRKKYTIQGYKNKLTREQMFMIALNSGNDGNRKDLIEGNKIPEEVIDRIFTTELTPQERQAVKQIWELLDTLFPMLDDVNKQLIGMPLKKVEGHYFPIVHDRKLSWRVAKTEDQNAVPDAGAPFYMAYPKAGHREARTGAVMPIKLDNIEIVSRHIHQAIHDITHTIPVIEVYHTFTDENVRKAIVDIAGDKMYQMLTPWIKNISRPDTGPQSIAEAWARALRKNTTVVYLGFKATTELLQLSALTQSMEELGAVQVGDAIQKMARSPVELKRQIDEKSVMMRFRGKTYDREFNMFSQQISTGTISRYTDQIGDWVLTPIAVLDQMAAYPTWLAAYNKALGEFKDAQGQPDEEKCIDFADSTVRRTQSAAGPKDLAVIQQGNEFKKWIAMFYTFFSVYWNKVNEGHKRAGIEGAKPKTALKMFRSFIYLTVIPSILSFIVVKGRIPEGDEWWKETLAYRLGGIPILRDIVGGLTGYDYEFSPAAKGIESITNLVKDTEGAREKWLEGDEINAERLLKDALWSVGFIYGLPASQTIITMDGIVDLWNDETDNPLRLLFREPREREE